jgi:hypothetical protein
LRKKVDNINDLISRQWTRTEINTKLERQSRHDHLLLRATKAASAVAVPSETVRRDEALQRRNEANRKYNQETIRAALIEENRKKKEAARIAAEKKAEEERRKALGENGVEGEKTTEPEKKKISLYHQRDYKKDLNSFTTMKTDDEIIGELDLAIDIEI